MPSGHRRDVSGNQVKNFYCIVTSVICLLIVAAQTPLFATKDTDRVLELVNNERIKAGVPPVRINNQLSESAHDYAQYLGEARFFGHVGPDGSTLVTRNTRAGYKDALWMGENIAAGYFSAESAVAAWMQSLPHRSNMLDPNFSEVGISCVVVKGSPYACYWVQEYGLRQSMASPRRADAERLKRAARAPKLRASSGKGVVSAGGQSDFPVSDYTSSGGERPVIKSLSPASAPHGDKVAVTGRGFGTSGILRFGGLVAKVVSWSDTKIVGMVPKGAISAGVTVASADGIISKGVGFRVTSYVSTTSTLASKDTSTSR